MEGEEVEVVGIGPEEISAMNVIFKQIRLVTQDRVSRINVPATKKNLLKALKKADKTFSALGTRGSGQTERWNANYDATKNIMEYIIDELTGRYRGELNTLISASITQRPGRSVFEQMESVNDATVAPELFMEGDLQVIKHIKHLAILFTTRGALNIGTAITRKGFSDDVAMSKLNKLDAAGNMVPVGLSDGGGNKRKRVSSKRRNRTRRRVRTRARTRVNKKRSKKNKKKRNKKKRGKRTMRK
jgi:hypothetical protein